MASMYNGYNLPYGSRWPMKVHKSKNPADVQFLTFEGGGGKGNAYPGAVRALEDPLITGNGGILQHDGFKVKGLQGFAGASAGAINSLFLSLGYTATEIDYIMSVTDFNQFMDAPDAGRVPDIGGFREKTQAEINADESYAKPLFYLVDSYFKADQTNPFPSLFGSMKRAFSMVTGLGDGDVSLIDLYRTGQWAQAPALAGLMVALIFAKDYLNSYEQYVKNKLKKTFKIDEYIRAILLDWAPFKGEYPRDFMDKWISIARYRVDNYNTYFPQIQSMGEMFYNAWAQGAPPTPIMIQKEFEMYPTWPVWSEAEVRQRYIDKKGREFILQTLNGTYDSELKKGKASAFYKYKNSTFKDLLDTFDVKLVFTGSNLETFRSEYFSADTVPHFPVADAVRISMGLPVFKPYIIRETDLQKRPQLLSGKPIYYKHTREKPSAKTKDYHWLKGVWVDGGFFNNSPIHAFENEPYGRHATLGFRLGIDAKDFKQINNIFGYLAYGWPGGFLGGAGETVMSATSGNTYRTINLEVEGFDTIDFNPPQNIIKDRQMEAYKATMNYFGFKPAFKF